MSVAERAKGGLRIDVSHPIQLMIATATGIAPYVGLLRDHLHRTNASVGRLRFVILHGASHADEFGYREELETLTRRYPDKLLYVPTVSRPASPRNRDWDGARGRVERHIEPTLRRLALNPGNTALFACGNPDMVRNVSEQYRKLGFTTQVEAFD